MACKQEEWEIMGSLPQPASFLSGFYQLTLHYCCCCCLVTMYIFGCPAVAAVVCGLCTVLTTVLKFD